MTDPSEHTEEVLELESSELGTKDYWLSVYKRDIKNYENHGDVGEIWFGEDSALRIISWIVSNIPLKTTSIVDLGCGNGMLLVELAREGFTNLTGIDYCQNAIELSESIIKSQEINFVKFKVVDLTGCVDSLVGFDLALDKGTYDAVSLDPDQPSAKRQMYIENIAKILKPSGLFIITSCNWTESELSKHFNKDFRIRELLPTPKFHFGGKVGNLVSSLVFEKKS